MYYVDLAGGFKIVVQPMATPLTKEGEPKVLIRPTEPWEKISGHVTEEPFMLIVKYAGNPSAHRGEIVLGPGHHCVVEGPHGKLWLVYHQKWNAEKHLHRFLAVDPLWFDDQGVIHTKVSRDTDEAAP